MKLFCEDDLIDDVPYDFENRHILAPGDDIMYHALVSKQTHISLELVCFRYNTTFCLFVIDPSGSVSR